ncbi:MAG: VCBS repeat-containing protein [Bryobacteraceae bacterium]
MFRKGDRLRRIARFACAAGAIVLAAALLAGPGEKLPLDRWTYIQVDNNRGKWGDFAEPDWLKYYGLSAFDVDGDGYLDIVSGRYFYRNPGGDMTGPWERTDLGLNVDAMLFVDVNGNKLADCVGQALPDIYWLEARDRLGKSWKAIKVASVPKAFHVNGQGFALAQIVPGGKPEIVLSTGNGIYYIEIPKHPEAGNWPVTAAAPEASEQGLGVGDVDGDGLIDIAAPYGDRVEPRMVGWWKNPGKKGGPWKMSPIGPTPNYSADRVAVADLNGDGRADVLVTEESWRTPDRVAQLIWFEQSGPREAPVWERHTILTAASLNSLDVADIDRDGDLDIVTCEHKGKDKRLFLFENDGRGRFTEHILDQGKESHLGTLLFDLDGDGDLDILSVAWDDYKFLHLWRNDAIRKSAKEKHR